jgi:hypothetical protein
MSRAKMRLALVAATALVALLVFQGPVWAQAQDPPKPPPNLNDSISRGLMFDIQMQMQHFGQITELRARNGG